MKDFAALYAGFQAPIAALNCGDKCAPYNERGVPFCCDTRHTIPTAYREEWAYLKANTDLWHPWESEDARVTQELNQEAPDNQVLVECQGHLKCQRNFRTLTCRSFPFFPYLDKDGEFVGLTYYWEYEDRCWVISNLPVVSPEYREQFCALYEVIFARMPEELENYLHHSIVMRRVFGRRHRAIPLLHRNGKVYKVSPHTGRMRLVSPEDLPDFGPYKIAAELPFPDELEPVKT